MSLHRSLKTKPAGLNQHRNVLRRDERIVHLMEKGEFDLESDSPFGLVKVGNRKVVAKKPKAQAAKEEGEGDGAEATEEAAASEGDS